MAFVRSTEVESTFKINDRSKLEGYKANQIY